MELDQESELKLNMADKRLLDMDNPEEQLNPFDPNFLV